MDVVFIRPRTKCVSGGQIHYEGHLKDWALKVETFLGPDLGPIWAQKSSIVCIAEQWYVYIVWIMLDAA